ncbi:MAG: hypothetical protein K0S09_3078 [Sphingobacteriaceae bacterium]|nr:hypothetical protein [Sphingobacteriaceae bacterium]
MLRSLILFLLLSANYAVAQMKPLPEGIVRAINFTKRPVLPDDYFKQDPWVQGLVIRELWADLEPEEGKFDWSYLDEMLAYGQKHQRSIVFLILTGGFNKISTPAWLTSENGYNRPTMSFVTGIGPATSVVPWDKIINEKWINTARKIAERYDKQKSFSAIYLAGVQARYPEMLIPNTEVFLHPELYLNEGYKSRREPFNEALDLPHARVYTKAWNTVLDSMLKYFKHTTIINMVDEFSIKQYKNVEEPMYEIVRRCDSLGNRVTVGTANLGYRTVIEPQPDIHPKYKTIVTKKLRCPVVYELGPRKQIIDGPDNQVYDALRFAKQEVGCRFVIVWGGTPNGTFGVPRFEAELKKASADFWKK